MTPCVYARPTTQRIFICIQHRVRLPRHARIGSEAWRTSQLSNDYGSSTNGFNLEAEGFALER